jgi:hypothetical protein
MATPIPHTLTREQFVAFSMAQKPRQTRIGSDAFFPSCWESAAAPDLGKMMLYGRQKDGTSLPAATNGSGVS